MSDPQHVDVAVLEGVWGEAFDRLADRLSVRRLPHPAELAPLRGIRALVVRNRTRVDRSLLDGLPGLRIVARAGVGLDNIDLAAADQYGVVVSSPAGANATSVAEHALGLALAVARGTVPGDAGVRAGRWDRTPGRELAGGTWGVLGYGATGRATAALARALGMRVVAHDPYLTDRPDGVRLADLAQTARAADVLSVHLPATPQTRHLVDRTVLELLGPQGILVNVGRGEAVDEDALADLLAANRLYGAGLDVRATEPPGASRLHRLDRVVLSPHIAGITGASQRRIAEILAHDIDLVLAGQPAEHAVPAGGRQ